MVNHLTDQQRRLLAAIRGYLREHGHAPTLRELAAQLGYRAHTSISAQLDALERKRAIARRPGIARSIRLLPSGGE